MIRIAIDAMGGDNAPGEIVRGAVDAAERMEQVSLILVGDQEKIERELQKPSYPKDRIRIQHASEVIGTEEHPVEAVRHKKDSLCGKGKRMLLPPPGIPELSWWAPRGSWEGSAACSGLPLPP